MSGVNRAAPVHGHLYAQCRRGLGPAPPRLGRESQTFTPFPPKFGALPLPLCFGLPGWRGWRAWGRAASATGRAVVGSGGQPPLSDAALSCNDRWHGNHLRPGQPGPPSRVARARAIYPLTILKIQTHGKNVALHSKASFFFFFTVKIGELLKCCR